jgi:hypothetical protein
MKKRKLRRIVGEQANEIRRLAEDLNYARGTFTILATGIAQRVVIYDGEGRALVDTTCSHSPLVAGNLVTIPESAVPLEAADAVPYEEWP